MSNALYPTKRIVRNNDDHLFHICDKEVTSKTVTSSDEFIAASIEIFGKKAYGYRYVPHTMKKHTMIKLLCKYHSVNFTQIASNHLKGINGCQHCRSLIKDDCDDNPITMAFSRMYNNFYIYPKIVDNTKNKVTTIICPSHGEFKLTLNEHAAGKKCKKCITLKTNVGVKSQAETVVFKYLLQLNTRLLILTSERNILGGDLELDMYIPSKRLAIEYNGVLYHSSNNSNTDHKIRYRHYTKTNICHKNDISLLHISSDEPLHKWKIKLAVSLDEHPIVDVLYNDYIIKSISAHEAETFLQQNDIQGYKSGSVRLGLFIDEQLVSVLVISKHNLNGGSWKIERLCTYTSDAQYNNSDIMMVEYFRKMYNKETLLVYASNNYTLLNEYERIGFKFVKDINPTFKYVKPNTPPSFRYIEEIHDLPLKDHELMYKKGFRRMWDSGKRLLKI